MGPLCGEPIPGAPGDNKSRHMNSKLKEARGEIIAKLTGLARTKGHYDKEENKYVLPVYAPDADNVSVFTDGGIETVDMVILKMVDGKHVLFIETDSRILHASEVSADDLDGIVERICEMDDEEIMECYNYWY